MGQLTIHECGWQRPQTIVLIRRSSFCGLLGVLLLLIFICPVSRHHNSYSSFSCCAQVDSDCVCACSCVGMCIVCVSCRWGYGGHGSTTVLSTEGSAVQWSPGNIMFASWWRNASWFLVCLAILYPWKSSPLLSKMSGPPNPNKVSVKPLLLSTISPTPQRLKDDVSFWNYTHPWDTSFIPGRFTSRSQSPPRRYCWSTPRCRMKVPTPSRRCRTANSG